MALFVVIICSMYSIMTTARLLRSGFTKRELARAERCCVRRVARGRYAVERTCEKVEHEGIWAAVREGHAQEFELFNDRRDAEQYLKALVRARAEKVNEEESSGRSKRRHEVFSHLSAALIHGLPIVVVPEQRVEVIRRGASRKHRYLRVRNTPLTPGSVMTIGIYRVTTLERTIVDVALTYELATALAMIDHTLRRELTSMEEIQTAFAERDAARAQRRARCALDLSDARRESPAESVAAARFFEHGIGGFDPQVEFRGRDGRVFARVDFCHRAAKVIIEVDGLAKYSMGPRTSRKALEDEKVRDAQLAALGYRVVHLTWRQLFLAAPFEDIKRIVSERVVAR